VTASLALHEASLGVEKALKDSVGELFPDLQHGVWICTPTTFISMPE